MTHSACAKLAAMMPYAVHEERARALLPQPVFDYYAGGAGDEDTLAANASAWSAVRLRPRVLRDVSHVDTSTTVLGTRVAAPVLVAPTAFHRLAHPLGELATAQGTAVANSLLVLSTRSSTRLESVAAAAGPWWFQVYVLRDRGLTRELVLRATASGARALVLTGDTPYVGRKRRNRDTLSIPDDVLRALALGARAVLLGRPILWGLALEGAAGVQRVLTELQEDTAHVMALAGASCVAEVTADLVTRP